MTHAAEAFDAGNLDYRIMNPGQDELGQLARTLNRMASSLNDNTISRIDWENTFNVLPDPVILVDNEGRFTRVNRSAALYLDVFPLTLADHLHRNAFSNGCGGHDIGEVIGLTNVFSV